MILHELGLYVRGVGRLREAEALYFRALEIKEVKVGADHMDVAATLHEPGRCVQEAGRPEDAGALFRRALEILEVRLGPAICRLPRRCKICVCVCA